MSSVFIQNISKRFWLKKILPIATYIQAIKLKTVKYIIGTLKLYSESFN